MSRNKERTGSMEPSTGQNRINEGTFLKGEIKSQGVFRIDGKIEGNVHTPSKVVIGKSGSIVGTLVCENADIEGHFEGTLEAAQMLTLRENAHVSGEVVVGKLAVEPGASLNASCTMKDAVKTKTLNTAVAG